MPVPATLPVLLLAVTLPLAVPAAAEVPLRLTTDSAAYCTELAARFSSQPPSLAEPVRAMASEGQRLCDSGQVRTGIAKLRRALRAVQPAIQPTGG